MNQTQKKIIHICLIIMAISLVLIAVGLIIAIATYGWAPVEVFLILPFIGVGAAIVVLFTGDKKDKGGKDKK